MYITILIKWYVLICFFHAFGSFLSKNLVCCDILLVSIGMDVALHVFTIVSDIF